MINLIIVLPFLFVFLPGIAYSQQATNYVVTLDNDTLYYQQIEIYYYKRANCHDSLGRKHVYGARNIKTVYTDGDTYESGRIVPLAMGWKKYLLLYRIPEEVENQEIILYSYSGASGGGDFYLTTYAVRNRNDQRGDFGKMSLNPRKKILNACPNCTVECADIIMNTEIRTSSDVYYKIIRVVNEKCSD